MIDVVCEATASSLPVGNGTSYSRNGDGEFGLVPSLRHLTPKRPLSDMKGIKFRGLLALLSLCSILVLAMLFHYDG